MYSNVEEKAYKQKRKMEFLKAGFALFSAKSIEAVTLEEVAKASGHGPATLYRYFDSKSGLLLEISAWKWGEFFEQNRRRRPSESFEEKTAADMFAFYLDSFLEVYRKNKALLRFNQFFNIYLQSEDAGQNTKVMYQKLMEPITDFFRMMYGKAKQDGTIRTDIPEEEVLSTTMHLMLAAVTRYAVGLVYHPPGGFDDLKELETLRDMLFRQYGTR